MLSLSSICIHKCGGSPRYNIEEVNTYIRNIYPKAKVKDREEFFSLLIKQEGDSIVDNLAREITLCRAHNSSKEVEAFLPFPLEIEYEKERLAGHKKLKGIVYDGFMLQKLAGERIAPAEQNLSFCHIIITDQLIATFDRNDKRYHLRVGVYGFPNIISTQGLIEALAKPKEYYFKKQLGVDLVTLQQEFKKDIIDHGDSRITELLKGYCVQALFNHIAGGLFCQDRNCRLFNAHWQKDAIRAQVESDYEFCPRHSRIINQWKI